MKKMNKNDDFKNLLKNFKNIKKIKKMLIYVRCITYGYYGKNDHLFNVNSTDTLSSFQQKIVDHFKPGKKIDMFDDETETLLDSYDRPLKECFLPTSNIFSITFSE